MEALRRAVAALCRGDLVAYPTDTLLGLGALATDRAAVDRLVRVKGRAAAQPVSLAVSSTEELEPLADLSEAARAFARRRLPGPYTILAPASSWSRRRLSPNLLSRAGTIGLRVPDHPVARELARRAGPITATSLNPHGEPPATTIAEARRRFGPAIAVYLAARPPPTGRPSTLVDLTGAVAREVSRPS